MDAPPAAALVVMPFAAGLLLGGLRALGCGSAAAATAGLLAAAAIVTVRDVRVTLAAAASGLAVGAVAAAWTALPPASDDVSRFVGSAIASVEGTIVASDPGAARVALAVAVDRVRSEPRSGPASGMVGVTIAHATESWPAGTRVRLVGRLRRPRNFGNPGDYDLVGALARRGIGVTMFLWDERGIARSTTGERGPLGWVEEARAAVRARVLANASRTSRDYLLAVLLGDQRSLDRDVRAALTRTGLAHVISVSGFHVAVVAGVCVLGLRRLGLRSARLALHLDATKLAAVAGTVPVAIYAAIAGASVPAARAFLMYAVVLFALVGDRPPDALRALAAAAVALALRVPDVAADVSFELSFVSVVGLVVAARTPRPVAGGMGRWQTFVVEPLRTSVAAVAATAPLTAWHFQQVSVIAPLANLLALPLLGPATLLPGLAALPFVGLAPPVADALLAIAGRAADLGLALARGLARVPGASVATPMPSLLELALCYAALALWWSRGHACWNAARAARLRRLASTHVIVVALTDVGWWTRERWLNPTLRVTFLSVGQGDAAVVELPRGDGVLVVDGGGLAGDFDPGERLIAPFLRSRKILHVDAVAMSHPQLDHYGGLAHLVTHFTPDALWSTGAVADAARFAELTAAVRDAGTRAVVMRRGDRRRWRSGVMLEVLHPTTLGGTSVNDGSLVLRLAYGATSVIFTGDVEHPAELDMLAHGVAHHADVLKVAHHGSRTSTSAAWLAAVGPTVAVVSSGAENRFGFPAPEVVRRLRAQGARVWNTAESGAVRVVSDGRDVHVSPTRVPERERFVFPTSLW